MADGGHVHPDLVRATRLKPDVEQTRSPERLQRVVVRNRRAPVGDDREPAVAGWVPANRRVYGAAQRIGMSLHERVIPLINGAEPERLLKRAVGGFALGDDHHAGSARVQPVDYALSFSRTAGRDRMPGGEQTLEDRWPGPAGCRMRGHPDGLIHHDDVRILIQNAESWYGFGAGCQRDRRRGQRDVEPVPGPDPG